MSASISKIVDLVAAKDVDMDALEKALDEATHAQRVEVTRRFTPAIQQKLFDAAQGRSVEVDQLVPPGRASLQEVIHHGHHTLPAFRRFQKHFCLPSRDQRMSDREVLWGYNQQLMATLTGPGYFVAYQDEDSGEVWIDYRTVPGERPDHWPDIVSNTARLGRFVYHGMVDRLRRLSEHCTIGRAYKGKPMDVWYVLVRED